MAAVDSAAADDVDMDDFGSAPAAAAAAAVESAAADDVDMEPIAITIDEDDDEVNDAAGDVDMSSTSRTNRRLSLNVEEMQSKADDVYDIDM